MRLLVGFIAIKFYLNFRYRETDFYIYSLLHEVAIFSRGHQVNVSL